MAVNLTIYGRLDGLNDYVLACRTNRYSGANMKRRNEDVIKSHILTQIPRERLKGKVHIHFAWYEPNKKRDLDNIAAAKKFILDSLVATGTIEADGWSCVTGFTDSFSVDKDNPRIEVYISSLEMEE